MNSNRQYEKTMGKQASKNAVKSVIAEDLNFDQKLEKQTRMWNFNKTPTLICQIIGVDNEKMEYEVYLIRELHTNEVYYLPMHSRIVEAFDEFAKGKFEVGYFKIVHEETVSFKDGKKTFNVYDISYSSGK